MSTESFLRISDIEGDSTDDAFEGAIEVLGYSWGLRCRGRPQWWAVVPPGRS